MMRKEQKNRYGLVLAAMIAAVSMTACGGQKTEQGTVSVQTEAHDDSKITQMPESKNGTDSGQTTGVTTEPTIDSTTGARTEPLTEPAAMRSDAGQAETPIGMPNPFTDNSTLEEAEKAAGFSIQIPDQIQGAAASAFRNLDQELLEVIYYDQNGQEAARIRKGTGREDISGDYVKYEAEKMENVKGKSVIMKGQDGKISLAIWNDGEYSYSVSVENAVSMDEMTELISDIK